MPSERDHVTLVAYKEFLGDNSSSADTALFKILHAVATQGCSAHHLNSHQLSIDIFTIIPHFFPLISLS
jgi:hypothetical protein